MKINLVTLLLIFVFAAPLVSGGINGFSIKNYKNDIKRNCIDVAFILGLFSGGFLSNKIFIDHNQGIYKSIYDTFPVLLTNYIDKNKFIIYLVIFPLIIFVVYQIIYLVLYFICELVIFSVIDFIEPKAKSRGNIFKKTLGVILKIPRAVVYLLLVTFTINMSFSIYYSTTLNNYAKDSKLYNVICDNVVIPATKTVIAKQLPYIINNSFRIQIKDGSLHSNTILYNGITLEDGIKSNKQIDDFSTALIVKDKTTYLKGKTIYSWIGKNIQYDDTKANDVLRDNYNVKSGTINTFNSKKGICFDFACLYASMCKANGIKVRMLTGEGFNGQNWVSHAWNQVYEPEEKRWINVDTTFYQGGDYFDNSDFEKDHRKVEIAGEW